MQAQAIFIHLCARESREAGVSMKTVPRPSTSRLRRLAPYFLIGPISGPLFAGVVINFRGGRPFLAALYAIALVQYALLLPLIAARLGFSLI